MYVANAIGKRLIIKIYFSNHSRNPKNKHFEITYVSNKNLLFYEMIRKIDLVQIIPKKIFSCTMHADKRHQKNS